MNTTNNNSTDIPRPNFPAPGLGAALEYCPNDADDVSAEDISDEILQEHANTLAWGPDLLVPKGLVGTIAKYILEDSIVPQPKFALAAALALCGTLLGREVMNEDGQRANLSILALAPTSAGKDAPLRHIMKILHALNRSKLAVAEATSDSAIEHMLREFPTRIFLIDEFGHYFTDIKRASRSSGSSLPGVLSAIMKAWSSANHFYLGKSRSLDTNGKYHSRSEIVMPFVSIYGTSVPIRVMMSIDDLDLQDGCLPRFITFISNTRTKSHPHPASPVPQELISKIQSALNKLNLTDEVFSAVDATKPPANILTVKKTPSAVKIFSDLDDLALSKLENSTFKSENYLYGKAVENAIRIATVIACFRNPDSPTIETYDAEYATRLVSLTIEDMILAIRTHKGRTLHNQIFNAILQAGLQGISGKELCIRTKTVPKAGREEAINKLKTAGLINHKIIASPNSKPKNIYTVNTDNPQVKELLDRKEQEKVTKVSSKKLCISSNSTSRSNRKNKNGTTSRTPASKNNLIQSDLFQ